MPESTLPLISMHSDRWDKDFVASLHEYGFAALTDHPIDMGLVRKIYDDWEAFFGLEEKHDFTFNQETQDGFFSLKNAESAKGVSVQDHKEYFHFYPWGQCPTRLKNDLLSYYTSAQAFAKILLQKVEDFAPEPVSGQFLEPLSGMIDQSDSSLLRILHYPPVPEGADLPRASAHEDINLLTLLPASSGPGLEILDRSGHWLEIADRDDQILINTGDMLSEASSQYFPSTTHRVCNSEGALALKSRMSLPLFLHPRPEVQLSTRYTAGDYLHERLLELGVISP
ncbi:MAG: hypothetical protein L7T26_06010 [Pseudomonadales bacterium]|nr:hypothetical protein [Pseudomonadales bacterium]